ncbi:hypothetical protein WDW86_05695 [Bdellovibrionota bacterium FG-2]
MGTDKVNVGGKTRLFGWRDLEELFPAKVLGFRKRKVFKESGDRRFQRCLVFFDGALPNCKKVIIHWWLSKEYIDKCPPDRRRDIAIQFVPTRSDPLSIAELNRIQAVIEVHFRIKLNHIGMAEYFVDTDRPISIPRFDVRLSRRHARPRKPRNEDDGYDCGYSEGKCTNAMGGRMKYYWKAEEFLGQRAESAESRDHLLRMFGVKSLKDVFRLDALDVLDRTCVFLALHRNKWKRIIKSRRRRKYIRAAFLKKGPVRARQLMNRLERQRFYRYTHRIPVKRLIKPPKLKSINPSPFVASGLKGQSVRLALIPRERQLI